MPQRATMLMLLTTTLTAAQSNLTAQVPAQDTYQLPRSFNSSFDNHTSAASQAIAAARNASFVSYDEDFLRIVGDDSKVRLLATSSNEKVSFAFEGGIWVPETNQVWFTAYLDPTPGYLSILDLNVYVTTFGDPDTTPAIVAINPHTYHAEEVVNSYFGLPLNGPDDVTVAVSRATGEQCVFFTDFFLNEEGLGVATYPGPSKLPYFVWRPVIGTLEIQDPNGLAVDKANSLLYVTDGPHSAVFQSGPNHTLPSFAGIYQYDLGGADGCTPLNKRLFAFARQGFANGIKVDDAGRVWTAEYEGVVVRNGTSGKVLGVFNAVDIIMANSENPVNVRDVAPLANFALVGDELVILAFDRIFGVKLAEMVIDPERYNIR
ncbi:Uu.00g125580.m01.CDS01 [Anthostomella pinea]|uniref:Uu.00g125580.m01.CDS01 n=1 Tax=Anthostomella pinea TaxID=933095 RepID=A0AAI8VHQ1_9PEZI|nr:Uu.00g125580.m01.CDS01 [Anthostomella pinea]